MSFNYILRFYLNTLIPYWTYLPSYDLWI